MEAFLLPNCLQTILLQPTCQARSWGVLIRATIIDIPLCMHVSWTATRIASKKSFIIEQGASRTLPYGGINQLLHIVRPHWCPNLIRCIHFLSSVLLSLVKGEKRPRNPTRTGSQTGLSQTGKRGENRSKTLQNPDQAQTDDPSWSLQMIKCVEKKHTIKEDKYNIIS